MSNKHGIIRLRRGTAAEWTASEPQPGGEVLRLGEPGYEKDTGKLKIGDGSTPWNSLAYFNAGATIDPEDIEDILGDGFLVAGTGIAIHYDDLGNSLTISTSGVSLQGHNHISSDITDFNSSVSGLLPVKDIVAGNDISVTSISGIYTINSTTTSVDEADSLVTTVFNKTGSTIPKMSVVYINGGQGDMPTVTLAIANSEATSSKTYGVTAEAIDHMSMGKVIVEGSLTGLNTDQFNPSAPQGDVNGTVVYLSPTISGAITTVKPYAPNHMVAVGTIVRTHQNEGIIEVRIQNGFELQELHNVAVTGVADGQFLQYNSGSGLWIPSSSGNFTSLSVNGTGVSLNGHTHGNVSSSGTLNNGNRIVLTDSSGYITTSPSLTFNDLTGNFAVGGSNFLFDTTQQSAPRNSGSVTIFGSNNPTLILQNESSSDYAPSIRFKPDGGLNDGLIISSYDVNNIDYAGIISRIFSPNNLEITAEGSDIFMYGAGLFFNGNDVSLNGHTHASFEITDFNSSVSGLLPTIANSGNNRILTSDGTSNGIVAESGLVFDGQTLNINDTVSVVVGGSGLPGSGIINLFAYSSLDTLSAPAPRIIGYRYGGSISSPTGVPDDATLLHLVAYTPDISGIVRSTAGLLYSADDVVGGSNIYTPSRIRLATSSGPDQNDNTLFLYSNGELYYNGFVNIDNGLSAPTPVYSLGTVSGNTAINYAVDRQIQTLTLNGTSINFTEGTGWTTADRSVDVVLQITVSSTTTVAFDSGFVTDWYSSLPTFSAGTYLILLRSIGSTVVQGHYIGKKL